MKKYFNNHKLKKVIKKKTRRLNQPMKIIQFKNKNNNQKKRLLKTFKLLHQLK